MRGDQPVSLEEVGLENRTIEDQTRQTAYHVPEGCLFVYDPQARNVDSTRTTISTIDIAPTILRKLAIHGSQVRLASAGG
jgi:hypothetical protein